MSRILLVRAYLYFNEDALTRAALELGSELGRRGHVVDYLAIPSNRSGTTLWLRERGMPRSFEQVYFLLTVVVHLLRYGRRYDVVVTCDTPLGLHGLVAVLGRLAPWRHVAWVMDLFYQQRCSLERRSSNADRRWAALEARCLRLSQDVVSLGECMRTRMQEIGLKPKSISVIPIWSMVPAERTDVEDDGEVNAGPLHILYSGHAAQRHPLGELVQAVRDATRTQLRIVGTGDEIDRVRDVVCQRERITVEGPLQPDEYDRASRQADIHVVSLADMATGTCVPSKTYAAMSMGKPILYIGSAHGQAAIDVMRAGAGWVVANERDAIVEVLSDIDSNRGPLTAAGSAGFDWAQQHRTLSAVGAMWSAHVEK